MLLVSSCSRKPGQVRGSSSRDCYSEDALEHRDRRARPSGIFRFISARAALDSVGKSCEKAFLAETALGRKVERER